MNSPFAKWSNPETIRPISNKVTVGSPSYHPGMDPYLQKNQRKN
jgi:hypothetical protein